MDFLLITPTDGSPSARGHLAALLASLAGQSERCELVLVLRGPDAIAPGAVPDNVTIHAIDAPLQTSLSRARNLALAHARDRGLLDRCHAVGFPDDDCAYPPGMLAAIGARLAGGVEMVGAAYGPAVDAVDWERFPPVPERVDTRLIMRALSSGTMFLASALVARLGDFDERFGLGARFGSAEDSDYMIRALAAGATAVYDPGVIVLHPYKPHRHEQYFPGTVAVLAKHALGEGRTSVELVKRLAIGLVLLARRRLGAASYMAGLRAATGMLLAAPLRPGTPLAAGPPRRPPLGAGLGG